MTLYAASKLFPLASIVALAVGLLGCEEASDGGQDPADTEGGDACFDESREIYDGTAELEPLSCGLPSPCPVVRFSTDALGCGAPNPSYDAMAGACVVESFRTGTIAAYEFEDCPGGQNSEDTKLLSFGDGTIQWFSRNSYDDGARERLSFRSLPDAEYFEACDASTADGFDACMAGLLDQECLMTPESCPGE